MRSRWIVFVAAVGVAGAALGQADDWYPSPWGPADQRGAANRITPAKVLEAKGLMTRGTVYQLGRAYEAAMPLFGTRHFSLRIPQTYGPLGTNETMYHDEVVSAEIGQVGTQFDGLGHIGVGDLFYNGNDRGDFSKGDGLTKLGVENVGPLVTRGVLVDVAAFKGVARLEGGYEITLADLRGALDDLQRSSRNARRKHARVGERHERVVVAADDESLASNLGQEAPARPAETADQLHGVAIRGGRQTAARADRALAPRSVTPRDTAVQTRRHLLEVGGRVEAQRRRHYGHGPRRTQE